MPELPEVETMRRGILAVEGCRIVRAGRTACRRRPIEVAPGGQSFQRRVAGQTIDQVKRLGKRVVLCLQSGDVVIIEPRMTGLVLLADPPTQEHLRFHFTLDGGSVETLWYWDRRGLGSVRLLSPEQLRQAYGNGTLGPDALDISADVLRARLAKSRREIKVALLDQRAVAGIGNLYAAEILHLAGIHPQRRCDRLRRPHWQAIHTAMREVLLEAIRYEGSTLGDGTYRNALNQSGTYQNQHRVYARAGQVCGRCGKTTIVRIVQAQRATFYCPRCQRKPRNN